MAIVKNEWLTSETRLAVVWGGKTTTTPRYNLQQDVYKLLTLLLDNFYGEVKPGKYLISGLHLAIERIWGLAGQLG